MLSLPPCQRGLAARTKIFYFTFNPFRTNEFAPMKKTVSYLAVFLSAFLIPAMGALHAQTAFEGTISWVVSITQLGDDAKHDMKVNVKGDKLETETDLGAMGLMKTYSDPASKKTYMVMGDSKSGMVRDNPSDSAIRAGATGLELKATGHKDTIAGHTAEEYTFKDGPADISLWASSGFPKSLCSQSEVVGQQDNVMPAAMKQLAKKGLFPVKLVISQQGEVAASMEFVKYEEKKLDDAFFVAPSDVKYGPIPQRGSGGTN
jgi:Domain of unknown function (DUF4412)